MFACMRTARRSASRSSTAGRAFRRTCCRASSTDSSAWKSSERGGSGLGLAIAKHAAERNRIDLSSDNRIERSGLVARVTFADGAVSEGAFSEGAGGKNAVKLSTAAW